ncbi:hypothetical protein EJ03DRAFT_373708 [Teratosphaeria nubilosa]|uniref:E3 ubiquitin-protein ligase n=1 Tax=Teratosphaeria nubilosa TaxID=161662 RepID=A0A6G1LBN9_9PEZI|nr:hypothetical protein EJ03DRAFT_373708 [Teratosphaeria nubilosa]
MQPVSANERSLNHELLTQLFHFQHRWTSQTDYHLRRILFQHLAGRRSDYLRYFFPQGEPVDQSQPWSLKTAQGAEEGREYTAAAKGTACGHIFKSGESTYHCKTCASDDTCVLCSRCFESSDHEDHNVFISVSPGNSGCCDCGDHEAWKKEVNCSIHTATADSGKQAGGKDKAPAIPAGSQLPDDLVESIRMTIARVVDYLCDVFSCSPEQMRLPKTELGIQNDERLSRLGGIYGDEPADPNPEYALILWNDEKHTVEDVQNQVARACQKPKRFGLQKAMEVNDVGRSVVHYSKDLKELMRMATVIEQIKVTVTIRSSRDTFREQMCAAMIDWIADISGCAVGNDPYTLRNVVCEELLKPWRMGSLATNREIGREGIDDHEEEENQKLRREYMGMLQPFNANGNIIRLEIETDDGNEDEDNDDNEDDEQNDFDDMDVEEDDGGMDVEQGSVTHVTSHEAADMDIDFVDENEDVTEAFEATLAGYPPPRPPPRQGQRRRILTPADSDDGEASAEQQSRPEIRAPYGNVPETPAPKSKKAREKRSSRPSKHWLEKPAAFRDPRPQEACEDLWQRVRLDFLILYDLRLWKSLRINLRHLYITTVVTIPRFKRILGLRFAGLYTALAQLYLIADREPDHSIINLSVQMLTTPSITEEVVERGNFLTNLMAILYTFLTTRQVGFPEHVSPKATLAFDSGAVTNRRMFHFSLDLRWLFQSPFIQYKMRSEQRYLLQFLDLVKLHQGVCPNVRALGEHVEYESDAWISASMIVKEINKLCKSAAVSFELKNRTGMEDLVAQLQQALRLVAHVTMINSFGYERKRFSAAELKDEMAWHPVGPFDESGKVYSVPKFIVQSEPMSFHHPLHYLLSWLFENAKAMSREELRALLHFTPDDLRDPWNAASRSGPPAPRTLTSDELLCGILEHPLRTYVWLAQMKAGMWVRNGITLRHQAHTYRSVSQRDVAYQRDLLLLQTGLVLCGTDDEKPGERYLAQIIDRFQMNEWIKGNYALVRGFEDAQQIDVLEDMYHLLVIALSERGNLVPAADAREQHDKVLQHDIAHALCFKPLSFSELAGRVTEKVGDSDDFSRVLESMTNYRPPEGLSDTGTFELKPAFIELVDPYYAHYSRNHREESESIYKKHMAQKTGKKPEEVVYEPRLQELTSGLFSGLAQFTETSIFVQIVCTALNFAAGVKYNAPKLQATRVETFLHMVLHLVMLATIEDKNQDKGGFVNLAASPVSRLPGRSGDTVVSLLVTLSAMDEYSSCHPTIKHILRKMQLRQPERLGTAMGQLSAVLDRDNTGSPASLSVEDKERRKAEAKARQARVMAKMKEQQNSFLQNQGLAAFGDEFEDLDDMSVTEEPESLVQERKRWSFPGGTCILCQEETDDQQLYGTFAFLGESNILRQTPTEDPDFVKEVLQTPQRLDRSADHLRPFGVAGDNKQMVQKITGNGKVVTFERQGLSKGFPPQPNGVKGPVSTSCGHIMHYSCFELYLSATARRHNSQIARNHPERIELKEFICPLCKALGNTFLPIIWKAKECALEHELHATKPFADWLADLNDVSAYSADLSFLDPQSPATWHRQQQVQELYSSRAGQYVASTFTQPLVASMQELSLDAASPTSSSGSQAGRYSLRRGYSLSSLFRMRRHDSDASTIDGGGEPSQPRMAELVKAYGRIEETIKVNKLCSAREIDDMTVNPVAPLSRALGLSVSAFEIAQRGTCNDPTASSLLADMSEQNLTHLRILSETIESFLAVNVLKGPTANIVSRETVKKRDVLTAQLFGSESEVAMVMLKEQGFNLLFQEDVFLFFADWVAFMAPAVAEASCVLQLCYWAEVCKAVFVYKELVRGLAAGEVASQVQDDGGAFHLAVSGIAMEDLRDPYARGPPLTREQGAMLRRVVEKYALTFLRKAIVLLHVRYGLDFDCPVDINPEIPELDRLSQLLHIPSLDDLCMLYTSQSSAANRMREITKRWLTQANLILAHESTHNSSRSPSITLPHPAIFELVGLPAHYDTLVSEALKRRCPTTGRDITDPAICLFCGEIFCSQAVCCMKSKSLGGCTQHMSRCGGQIGIFLIVRKCMVLFLHGCVERGGVSGSWAVAPYLDRHGEPDPTLRRHQMLFLEGRRVEGALRRVWLGVGGGGGVRSFVSRRLEGDVNPGGWETL